MRRLLMLFLLGSMLLIAVTPIFLQLSSTAPTVVAAVPTSGTISNTSGSVSWDFAPVVGGTGVDVGVQDICPPSVCDNYDLRVMLPAPAATFYQTMTAKLTIKYTWNSTLPTWTSLPSARGETTAALGRPTTPRPDQAKRS